MGEDLAARVAAVAALDEPSRRRLYDHVARQSAPVSRDEAAAAVDLARTTAAFHLDRLVAEGLLEVSYERRTGRTGPGAGRTAKLYRRSQHQVGVSLPERRYDLAGRLLAAAVAEAEETGERPRDVADRKARELGRELARAAAADGSAAEPELTALRVLEDHGFEPREEGAEVALVNCPFHALAQEHTALVCGMNLQLCSGLLAEAGVTGLAARLDPRPGHCCVRLTPETDPQP